MQSSAYDAIGIDRKRVVAMIESPPVSGLGSGSLSGSVGGTSDGASAFDVYTEGGFPEDFRGTVRLTQVFRPFDS